MKLPIASIALSLLIGPLTSVSAFDIGGLKDKAAAVTEGSSYAQIASLGSSLATAFKGNEKATQYASSLMNSLKSGKYEQAFDYYDKIKSVKLSPDQLAVWNDVKNPLSAFILEQNFDYQESGLADLVSKASSALQGGETTEASNYLDQLKKAAQLNEEQSSLLSQIKKNLLPVEAE